MTSLYKTPTNHIQSTLGTITSKMETIINYINENRGIIALLSITISVISKYIQLFILKKNLQLNYSLSNLKNTGNDYFYNLLFWNSGSKSIKSSDFPSKGKIKIIATDGKINKVKIVNQTNEFISTQIVNTDNEYIIDFDFLDEYDGIICKVITCNNCKINITGKPISAPLIKESNPELWNNFLLIINAIFAFSMFIGGFILIDFLENIMNWDTTVNGKDLWKATLPAMLLGILAMYWIIKSFMNKRQEISHLYEKYIENKNTVPNTV